MDYLEVLTTTCDLLIQVYTKIATYLGMNGEYNQQHHVPHQYRTPTGGIGSNGGTTATGGGGGGGVLLSQGLAEIVLKIDAKLKVSFFFFSPSSLLHLNFGRLTQDLFLWLCILYRN